MVALAIVVWFTVLSQYGKASMGLRVPVIGMNLDTVIFSEKV